MAKREPLFEADLGDNGGLIRLWDADDVERFIAVEQSFWRVIHQGNTSEPFGLLEDRVRQCADHLRKALQGLDKQAGNSVLLEYFGNSSTRIPLSSSHVAESIAVIRDTAGLEAAKGALAMTIPPAVWNDGSYPSLRSNFRGMIEQVVHQHGITPQSIEAAKRSLNGINARASQVLSQLEDRANEQLSSQDQDFAVALKRIEAMVQKQLGEALATNSASRQTFVELAARFEATHNTYLEQMRLKAPVEYWRAKSAEHKRNAGQLRNWLMGFFALMIGGYVIALAGLSQEIATFLLQFQGSTSALLVISAAFALLASLPLWVGRLLVKFYLSEHHLATDAKEREVMTKTYLALTADGVVGEKDRSLILGALFRSTPDGVVKDNTQPDTSAASVFAKLLDSR